MSPNILVEHPSESVRVARFLRPDVREAIYDQEAIPETSLYKELFAGAINDLPRGGTVVLNFGLIDWFPTAFYRLMIQALQEIRARGGRLVVCCLSENVREGFEVMGGTKLFESYSTEARAVAAAKKMA